MQPHWTNDGKVVIHGVIKQQRVCAIGAMARQAHALSENGLLACYILSDACSLFTIRLDEEVPIWNDALEGTDEECQAAGYCEVS